MIGEIFPFQYLEHRQILRDHICVWQPIYRGLAGVSPFLVLSRSHILCRLRFIDHINNDPASLQYVQGRPSRALGFPPCSRNQIQNIWLGISKIHIHGCGVFGLGLHLPCFHWKTDFLLGSWLTYLVLLLPSSPHALTGLFVSLSPYRPLWLLSWLL